MAQPQSNGHWVPNGRANPRSSRRSNGGGHRVHLGGDNNRHPRSGPIVCIDPGIVSRASSYWEKCILGYIVDDRKFSVFGIKRIIEDHWVCRGNITIHRMGDIYALHMASNDDKEDLIARTMVCLDGAVMVIRRWFPRMVPRTVRFPYACMWVRMCGLPFEYLNNEVAHTVGHIFGNNFEVDHFNNVPRSDYLRFRVCMSIGEPLLPGFFLTCDDGFLMWVQFRYEEVFKYCVRCGRVGHVGSNCTERVADIEADINLSLQRLNDKGYVIFQAENSHTMFDIDLRALPSTTKYLTSKVRLGNCEGTSVPAGFFAEQFMDFELGLSPGGRIQPGMRFQPNTQPFSSVVIGIEGHRQNGEEDMEVTEEENQGQQDIDPQAMDENQNLVGHEEEVQGVTWFVPDAPYVGAIDHGQSTQHIEENAIIQANINLRVEENEENEVGNAGFGGWLNASSPTDFSSFESTRGWPYGNSSEDGLGDLAPINSDTVSDGFVAAREVIQVDSDSKEEMKVQQHGDTEVIIIEDSVNSIQGRREIEIGDSSMIPTQEANHSEEMSKIDRGKEVMAEEWQRFYVDRDRVHPKKLKRETISDPKLVLMPDNLMETKESAIIYLREMDKRLKETVTPILEGNTEVMHQMKESNETFHTSLLSFDLEEKAKGKYVLFKKGRSMLTAKDGGKSGGGYKTQMQSAVDEVNTYFSKLAKWPRMVKKRKAVSDPMLGLVPDDFLKSMELSKQFLSRFTKKMRGSKELGSADLKGGSKQNGGGFRVKVDKVGVDSSSLSVESTTSFKGISEVGLKQSPNET